MPEPDAPQNPSPRTTPPLKRLLVAAGAAAVVGGGLLGMAMALDEEPTQVAVQRAPLRVGPGATTPTGPQQAPAPAAELPPLTITLDKPPPDGIADLDAAQQVVRLREVTATPGAPARRYVEMGRAQMSLGDTSSAERAFRDALARAPGDTAATLGITFVDFLSGDAGKRRAVAAVAQMARERPRDQMVSFNQGMLAAYAGDANGVVRAWQRTVEINPRTHLGLAARMLLERLAQARG